MTIPVFDAHCDTVFQVSKGRGSLRENRCHLDLMRGLSYSPRAQFFAVFSRPVNSISQALGADYSSDWPADTLEALGFELLALLEKELALNQDLAVLCLSASDARTAAKMGKTAAFISVEGAELIGCSLPSLRRAYTLGVRMVNLCWNFDNPLCSSAAGKTQKGLTDAGKAYVKETQRLGMAVDLSHASDRTFWDTVEISRRPVLASHSNSRSLCPHPRNLTDAQFREIVRLGGAVGLNLCCDFLSEDGFADINSILEHCEHFLALGGEKTLCLGGDLDGIDFLPRGITGIESYSKIYEAMLRRNYPEALVRDIFYNNLLNVLENAL